MLLMKDPYMMLRKAILKFTLDMSAEAMVDADTEVAVVFDGDERRIVTPSEADRERESRKKLRTEVVSPKGKLLTLTAEEAIDVGLAESMPEKWPITRS